MGVERIGFWAEGLEGAAIENAAIGLSLGGWEYTELRTQPPASERPKPLIARRRVRGLRARAPTPRSRTAWPSPRASASRARSR